MPSTSRISSRTNCLRAWCAVLAIAAHAVDPEPAWAQAGWMPLESGSTASLRGLSVVDDRVIWASGSRGTVLRSIDGGSTWTAHPVPGAESLDLRGIHARSALVAHVAATAGRIWRTTDGGQSWSLRYQAADTSMFLDAITFTNDRTGFTLGDPILGMFVLLTTTDGGESWLEAPPHSRPVAAHGEAAFAASGTSLVFHGPRHAWLGTGGEHARILRTTNGGATWLAALAAIPPRAGAGGVFSVAFADTLRGVAVGGDYERPDSTAGTASYTLDGGVSWLAAERPPRGYRSGVAVRVVRNRVFAVAVGTSGTDVSDDGGRTWSPLDATAFNAVQFAPAGVAFAVGGRGRIARLSPGR